MSRSFPCNKRPGQPFGLYPKVYRLLRRLKPDVLHSCNLAAMEFAPMAALARMPLRVHAEHGWDVGELGGSNARYRFLRRLYKPFVHEFIAVAEPQRDYLLNQIGVPAARSAFHPERRGYRALSPTSRRRCTMRCRAFLFDKASIG
jgi:hypothetical protein